MKSTGMSRELDGLGRIVIPKELRDILDFGNGDPVMFFAGNNQIGIKKYMPGCVFCGEVDNVIAFHGYKICGNCHSQLSSQTYEHKNTIEM